MPIAGRSILGRQFWVGLWQNLTGEFLHSLLHVIGIVLGYLILRALLMRLIDGILARLLARETRAGAAAERSGRLQTLQGLVKSLLAYGLFFIFGVLLLDAVGFNIMPFIETAGVIGLAIGFGAQKLVKDVISGCFIIVDDLFVVGDVITIGAMTGQVQEMGMRVTRVLDSTGRLYLISNGDIGTVTNLSRYPVTDYVEIAVGAGADTGRVIQIANTICEQVFAEESAHLKAPPKVQGITAFTAASITLRVAISADPRALLSEQIHLREALRTALLAASVPLA